MKKFLVMAVILVSGLMINVGVVAAQCDITNTGPGSTNTCNEETENTVEVTCENGIYVEVTNSQNSSSGGANNSGNTTGGGATTGNAVNQNGQTVTIGASCTTATPTGGSGGGTTPSTPTATTVSQVTAVPVGAVHAGGGAGTGHITAPLVAGMTASIAAAAFGLALLERRLASSFQQ